MVAVYAFAAWTVFVWGTRVRNIVEDQGSTVDLLAAVALAVLGVAVAVTAWKGGLAPVLALAAAVTVAVWAVRLPLLVFDDHGIVFKAVHVALAAVSVSLALAAWRAVGFWPASGRGRHRVPQAGTNAR